MVLIMKVKKNYIIITNKHAYIYGNIKPFLFIIKLKGGYINSIGSLTTCLS